MCTVDDFELLLYQGAEQMPPELTGGEPPKPWKTPMDRICWGLALINITFHFAGLDVILPAVGTVLLWLGLRALRRENSGFRFAYRCATVYAVLRFTNTAASATPLHNRLAEILPGQWHSTTGTLPLYHVVWAALVQLLLVLAVGGLWRGLKQVFRDAGQAPKTGCAGALVVLEALLIPLAVIGVTGWLLVGPLLVLWIVLVRNLFKLSRSLDEAGYALEPAPVSVSDGHAAALWLGIVTAATVLGVLLSGRAPMEAAPVEDTPTTQAALREQLLDLGFPEDILADLTDEEVAVFDGAAGMNVYTARHNNNGSRTDAPLVTFVEVQVAPYRNVYLAAFQWETPPRLRSIDSLEIIPAYSWSDIRSSSVDQSGVGTDPVGKMLWDRNGVTYAAPLDISAPSDTSYTGFFGQTSYRACYADFSLPLRGDCIRVYTWWSLEPRTQDLGPMWFNYAANYIHRQSPWVYPYQTGSQWAAAGRPGGLSSSPFLWLQEWGQGLLADTDFYRNLPRVHGQ